MWVITCTCLKWLVFLIRSLYLINTWFGEDQRANDTCVKEIGLCHQLLMTVIHSIVNTIWENLYIHIRSQQTCTFNNHNQIRGGLIFNLVLHVFNHRCASGATRVLLRKSNRRSWKA